MGYHHLCKGYVLEWNIGQNLQNEGDLLKRRQTLQLEFVDRFPFEQRTSRIVYHGVMVWYGFVFASFPLSSFRFLSCFHVSCDGFCWIPLRPRFFLLISFFLFLSCFFSCCICILSSFCFSSCGFFPPANCILHVFFHFHPVVSFFRLVLRVGTKPKRRQTRRQNWRQRTWHGLAQELANLHPHPATIAAALRQLLLPLRCVVMVLLQAFVLPPAKHQHHHRDDYC